MLVPGRDVRILRTWARGPLTVRHARLSMCAPVSVDARTVPVRPDLPASAAQILNTACSNEAGAYVVARDDRGQPLSLSATPSPSAKYLTFLPFESDDKLAQRTFWLSAAYAQCIAVEQVCKGAICSVPMVTESAGNELDATSGYTIEVLRARMDPPLSLSAHLHEAHLQVDEALQTCVTTVLRSGSPKVADEELSDIERAVKQVCQSGLPLSVEPLPWHEACGLFGHNPLVLRTILDYADHEERVPVVYAESRAISVLPRHGDTTLLRQTKPIKAVKVLGWSTATLQASWALEGSQPLLRIRGIAFPSSNDLQKYKTRMSDLEKSDHRHLGMAQQLFFAHDSSPGSPFVMPHGMRLIRKVERVIRDLYDAFGYEEVQTPQLYRSSLWKQSGHWDKYRDDMFSAQGFSCCGEHDGVFGLKPMNCPGHCVMFAHQPRSYRELPWRLAEFSPLHRNEASGSLSGLTRVRRFHQDDAHVFCMPSQVAREIESMLHMLSLGYRVFGFGDRYELVLSTRPDNFIGDISLWDRAEANLKQALDQCGKPWSLNEGDGAFYGPKIDIRLVDAMGRKHQTATIQLDFQLPERFQLEYAQAPSEEGAHEVRPGYARPVMIHRAILGSFERFLAILVEQCKGWWPFWLSPRQAVVIPAFGSDPESYERTAAYAQEVQATLCGTTEETRMSRNPFLSASMAHHTLQVPSRTRFQVELPPHYLSSSGDTLGRKVRHAQLQRYNFILIVGQQETQSRTINVRLRDEKAAPAWHAGAADSQDSESLRVQDMVWAVAKATFPEKIAADAPPSHDLGTWTLPELRRLFCVLDTLHV
ncbi:Similar to S.cerevisiae protein THS1 (Threonyl-tRNA synthetase) [Malassezia sympodialis ATCC 42132]|uniref:threonine--tRNA ligase n=2 Tax=Malassezia sympodialis (strain ATCC 42132) TaxID=1230383 RepID=A0A1M7ZZZ3_MALS4|nr:Similar to S.cerevisiae protein THS1 (Threonyl-tRNA synthetase) [Malassezia sympodialis ATCC 42132]